jgi:dienelactone hydrolase
MDESAVTRRRLLQLAGIAAGMPAAAACTPLPPFPAPVPLPGYTRPTAATGPGGQPRIVVRTGQFVSAYRPGTTTHWSLAAPHQQDGAQLPLVPVAVFLHGRGSSHRFLLDDLAADEVLQRHVDGGGTPFAIAAVDGGDTWWHARRDGSDTQSMLVREFVPFLGAQGFDLGQIGLFGLSMGGFGALLLASQARLPGIRAVAAMSPAVWSRYDAGMEGAFDSPADFAANDVFALRPRLAAIPKRVDCGTDDELAATVREYVSAVPGPVEGGFQPGGHDTAYWRSVLPAVLSFLGRNLG